MLPLLKNIFISIIQKAIENSIYDRCHCIKCHNFTVLCRSKTMNGIIDILFYERSMLMFPQHGTNIHISNAILGGGGSSSSSKQHHFTQRAYAGMRNI
jgi:hypothetical protein